ncbi:multidrug ABC transporter ATP-binding protein [Frondihabitans sp. PAMC 28766]|uniref:ABC transporter ATP-binding protein n=1 Tax=Frondihabitans sp. PAMC 28766 TaxID=1795630 RepID=UPI00078B2506|nr:ABC transporter ATP-binding protein [Frondihabitans sp. PAMC 28766]AMM19276.1 multidrug ABC transporter ATP-binding protein [Frondihabitans sp. PAMC 28766]
MIEATNLTKSYASTVAVDSISFRAEPGIVTGFLGPNGAGKSTTMRMLVGLDKPTSGRITVDGREYREHAAPLHEVSALLDAKAVHPQRSARDHLRILARTHGITDRRVDEVLDFAGLTRVARKRVGGFSLGMGQRVGIAAALLADPKVLVLDEPVNGLDPEGVTWIRDLLRHLAGEGRTVLLSSHLMAEMAQTADRVIVLGKGRIVKDASLDEIVHGSKAATTRVRSTDLDRLVPALQALGASVTRPEPETALVGGPTPQQIAAIALETRAAIFEIAAVETTLEEAFFDLTHDSVEYRTPTEWTSQ